MQETTKHRLVGGLVLISLATIFLPSLIYRDGEVQEIVVRPQIPIPPAPVIELVEISPPPRPISLPEPPALFEPEAEESSESTQVASSPRLMPAGVPEGWLIQVASLSLEKSATLLVSRLKADGYAAYWKLAQTTEGERFRVFVGPQIDKKTAEEAKAIIDKSYQVKSRLMRFNPVAGN